MLHCTTSIELVLSDPYYPSLVYVSEHTQTDEITLSFIEACLSFLTLITVTECVLRSS